MSYYTRRVNAHIRRRNEERRVDSLVAWFREMRELPEAPEIEVLRQLQRSDSIEVR